MTKKISAHLCDTLMVTLTLGAILLLPRLGHAQERDHKEASMAGMDMRGDDDMSSMGPTMAAMTGHMYIEAFKEIFSLNDDVAHVALIHFCGSGMRHDIPDRI